MRPSIQARLEALESQMSVVLPRTSTLPNNLAPGVVGIIAGTVRTRLGATPLTAVYNRIDTSTAPVAGTTLGDGVVLPASFVGTVFVINNTSNLIQLYATGGDTINGVAGATGVPLAQGDVAILTCAGLGVWSFDAGVGASGALPTELAADNISAAGAAQGTATQLVAVFNKVTTAMPGQGIRLPASAPGLDIIVENHSGSSITVYGGGNDTIDDVPTGTGVVMMDSSVVFFTCYTKSQLYSNGLGSGYARNPQAGVVLGTVQFADGLTSLGVGQGTALQLLAQINNVTTVGAGTGVNLPASAPGLSITVENNGANPLTVYPAQGSLDTINGVPASVGLALHAGTVGVFNCTAAGAWFVQPSSPVMAALNAVANADANTTLTAAQITGAVAAVDVQMTGNISAGRNLTTPTAAQIVGALHAPTVGTSYRLRITNAQANANPFTVVAGANVTVTGGLAGSNAIPQNTWREYVVTVTAVTVPVVVMKSVANGTWS